MNLPTDYTKLDWKQRKEVRERYILLQKHRCKHCGESLYGKPPLKIMQKKVNLKLFPPNFFKYPIHLHHDHKTGMTIGAVHNYCNAVLWQYHGK